MPIIAKGTFTVQMKPQGDASTADGVSLGRMSLDKTFAGDLVGTGKGEMLTALTGNKGSAGYVAIERVTGVLNGITGAFVLQHNGIMDNGAQSLAIRIVPDSGTGGLVGIHGEFRLRNEGGVHSYELEHDLPRDSTDVADAPTP
ncbi:MAG: DUF3224 domain-containing protein [Gemmatimonadaceae bacterium]|nr:DUF3224 domain-containing protein [Gemmatimonadaceae bacterium]